MRKTFDSREAEVTQVCPSLCPYVDTFSPNAKETGVPGEEDLTTLTGVGPSKQAEKRLRGTRVLPCAQAVLSPAGTAAGRWAQRNDGSD